MFTQVSFPSIFERKKKAEVKKELEINKVVILLVDVVNARQIIVTEFRMKSVNKREI